MSTIDIQAHLDIVEHLQATIERMSKAYDALESRYEEVLDTLGAENRELRIDVRAMNAATQNLRDALEILTNCYSAVCDELDELRRDDD